MQLLCSFGSSVNHNSLRWTVTPSSGTKVKFASIDSNGATSFAGPVSASLLPRGVVTYIVVQYSVVEGSTDCLNSSSLTSSSPTQKRGFFEIHLYFDKKYVISDHLLWHLSQWLIIPPGEISTLHRIVRYITRVGRSRSLAY